MSPYITGVDTLQSMPKTITSNYAYYAYLHSECGRSRGWESNTVWVKLLDGDNITTSQCHQAVVRNKSAIQIERKRQLHSFICYKMYMHVHVNTD